MTPQERQLITDLFDRLASLEHNARDPDAERAIAQEMERAPHAGYALVQTVLVQDETLKRADARIRELEGRQQDAPPEHGFLDGMRDSLFGTAERRGSVPQTSERSKWNAGGVTATPPVQPGFGTAPGYAPAPGGSFLGTAAATAAGAIGGGLLFGAIRNLTGGQQSAAFGAPNDGPSEPQSPWGNDPARANMARDAGLNDIGGHAGGDTDTSGQRAGLLDASDSDDSSSDDFDLADDGGSTDASDA